MALEFGKAGRRIRSYDNSRDITKTLIGKERIEFARIPAGRYVLGSDEGYANEMPRIVDISKPFWMSVSEITNSQFQTFAPNQDSRFAMTPGKDQASRGGPLYAESQPAVRVSHARAEAFCEWFSEKTGRRVRLPTEEEWEWAARAGTDTDTWYGPRDVDFGAFANLSDKSRGHSANFIRRNTPPYFMFTEAFDDGHAVSAPVGSYEANNWGLHDMIGNVEEWTASTYQGREDVYVVRGGSWSDMPKDATSATRWGYDEGIRLPDLGFRIVVED